MSATHQAHAPSNPMLRYPGMMAMLFATVVLAVFMYALYLAATSHHEGPEGAAHGEHGAASGAPAYGAPSASAHH